MSNCVAVQAERAIGGKAHLSRPREGIEKLLENSAAIYVKANSGIESIAESVAMPNYGKKTKSC